MTAKFGVALAISIGGILYARIRNHRIQPSFPPPPPPPTDHGNQVGNGGRLRIEDDPQLGMDSIIEPLQVSQIDQENEACTSGSDSHTVLHRITDLENQVEELKNYNETLKKENDEFARLLNSTQPLPNLLEHPKAIIPLLKAESPISEKQMSLEYSTEEGEGSKAPSIRRCFSVSSSNNTDHKHSHSKFKFIPRPMRGLFKGKHDCVSHSYELNSVNHDNLMRCLSDLQQAIHAIQEEHNSVTDTKKSHRTG